MVWHDYLVLNLSIGAHKTFTESDLSAQRLVYTPNNNAKLVQSKCSPRVNTPRRSSCAQLQSVTDGPGRPLGPLLPAGAGEAAVLAGRKCRWGVSSGTQARKMPWPGRHLNPKREACRVPVHFSVPAPCSRLGCSTLARRGEPPAFAQVLSPMH